MIKRHGLLRMHVEKGTKGPGSLGRRIHTYSIRMCKETRASVSLRMAQRQEAACRMSSSPCLALTRGSRRRASRDVVGRCIHIYVYVCVCNDAGSTWHCFLFRPSPGVLSVEGWERARCCCFGLLLRQCPGPRNLEAFREPFSVFFSLYRL